MITRSGANWTMHHGDATAILGLLEPVDHVITDPPYEAEAHTKLRRSCTGKKNRDGSRTFRSTPLSFDRMDAETRAYCGVQFGRLARRWILVFCQIEGVPLWRLAVEGSKPRGAFTVRHMRTGIWVKPDATPQFTGDRPGTGYECIEIMHAKGRARWNGGGTRGVWTYAPDAPVPCVFVHNAKTQSRDRSEDHETPKPIDLMLRLVDLFTDPGETVLDAFAGSGKTGIACLRRGRKFVGIERDERWFESTCAALAAEEANSTLAAFRAGQVPLLGGTT